MRTRIPIKNVVTKKTGGHITSSNLLGLETGDFIVLGFGIMILDALRWGIRCGVLGIELTIDVFFVIRGVEFEKLVTRGWEDDELEPLVNMISYKGNTVNIKPAAVKI